MYKLRMFLLRTFKPTTYKRYASMLLWKVFIKPQREQNMITSAIDRAFGESAKNLTTPNKDYFEAQEKRFREYLLQLPMQFAGT